MINESEIIRIASRSVKWSALTQFFPRLVTPLTTVILGALLVPDEFGIVAAATVIVSFAQIVVGAGWAQALIQTRENIEESSNAAFWASVTTAMLLYAALWFAAPQIAATYENPVVSDVLRVTGLTLIFTAMGDIARALVQRDLRFRALFWTQSLPTIFGSLLSIVWAAFGGGVWALVIGPLAASFLRAIAMLRVSRWTPTLKFQWQTTRKLLVFGGWVFISGIQTWLFLYADNGIAGILMGTSALGIYSLGFSLAMLVPTTLSSPLSEVAYPSFSALQHEPLSVGEGLVKLQARAAMLMFPAAFGISAIASPLIDLIYGTRWAGLGFVLQVLSIMPGLVNLWSLNADAYRAVGRPDLWTKVAGAAIFILFPLLFIAGQYGLEAYTIARFIGSLPLPILNMFLVARIFKISMRRQFKAIATPLFASLFMYVLIMLTSSAFGVQSGLSGALTLALLIAAGAAFYLALIWLFDRSQFQILISYPKTLLRGE